MKIMLFFLSTLLSIHAHTAPRFTSAEPVTTPTYAINSSALCATAKETLAYLNKGTRYDPGVIHGGTVFKLPLARVKATLVFICQHQKQLNNPAFIKKHFEFIRWYPDLEQTKLLQANKPLLAHLPGDKILMTKYYVHRAKASKRPTPVYSVALYGLPHDEDTLTLEEADAKPRLLRFKYGKQAILKGALANKNVPVLAYLKRDDFEAALMQGTLVADFYQEHQIKTFNVHRSNNVPYNKNQNPYQQQRYWYFKAVDGINGYGKDAGHKITVNSEVTFAADLQHFGLGKLLMVQYSDAAGKLVTRAGVLADTGGAFVNNLYQVDFLTGSYAGKEAFYQANHHLPDYVTAYFMVLKK